MSSAIVTETAAGAVTGAGARTRLVSLELRGFRAFGVEARTLQTDEPLIVLHAGNSQGKTSLAEAIEFLISGRSSRRELLGGAKAEYDGSLRNAHLPEGDDEVYVEAVVRDPSGALRRVRRQLLSDFGRGTECVSRLLVDGVEVADLSAVGIALAEGPVRAPVLLQHILRHVLSTEPKQRVGYFKALLELTDLDQLRERVKALRSRLESEQVGAALSAVTALSGQPFAALIAQLRTATTRPMTVVDATTLVERLILNTGVMILRDSDTATSVPVDGPTSEFISVFDDLDALQTAIDRARDEHRERSFPLAPFDAAPAPDRLPAPPDLSGYAAALAAADARAARLAPVIDALLSIDSFAGLVDPLDCPLCGTAHALNADRVRQLRQHLLETRAIDDAAKAATRVLTSATSELDQVAAATRGAVPAVAAWDERALAAATDRLTELGLDADLVTDARDAATRVASAAEQANDAIDTARHALIAALGAVSSREPLPPIDQEPAEPDRSTEPSKPTEPADCAKVTGLLTDQDALSTLRQVSAAYDEISARLRSAVAAAIRERGALPGLSDLSELLLRRGELVTDLVVGSARQRTIQRMSAAERGLREAAGKVLDIRFEQMSDTITAWWRTIRPEELVDFGGVKRRAGGALFVNLVAALRADAASHPVEREALGVYSDSQLNALGLSIFLARTQLLSSPIVVLDDPIPGSDADHRSTFVENTLGQLLDDGIQVVLCTFDGKLVQHARAIHDWRGLSGYDLTLLDATSGTEVTPTADTFSQLLLEAEDNLHSPTARSRRAACTSLRSAAERLAKQVIATGRTNDGYPTSVADVHAEASVLGKLVPLVNGYALDNAEKGQWRSFNTQLNPGSHDDDVPSTITLKQVRSNLRNISKSHRAHWPNGLSL
ncbi:AAA family ATPase [Nakamurella endophytica]|uniref:Rad50/SbcC-type AAA domain-containing protein n=1 Tax=Nakamurella endophytica TaxID=1748367 RepID=A0A917T535_9ACTN|nr:AAA family ATPase [Nakamurella endophytica]GGM09591.1 hypothetical protein GCM10011594_31860 [Nakamurella endophytica]